MPDGEFKATIIRILTGFEKRIRDISKSLTTERKVKKESEMENAMSKIGNRLDAMNSRLEESGMN